MQRAVENASRSQVRTDYRNHATTQSPFVFEHELDRSLALLSSRLRTQTMYIKSSRNLTQSDASEADLT